MTLTAQELRRMKAWVDKNQITPLHFESKADFDRFVEKYREVGLKILSAEDMGLEPDSFPGDFFIVIKEGWMLYDFDKRMGL